MAESILALHDILVRHGAKTVLQVAHLEIAQGEVLAVLGPNGAGKTTLLRVMGLLQLSDAGEIRFKGSAVRAADALAIRRRIANVFQEPLLLNTTVYQNAALGLKLRGFGRGEIEARLTGWLNRLGISQLSGRSARTLSGGEAQRTSLARALALEPELLLLDEPFSALDPTTREALLSDFLRIIRDTGTTTVFVTHDRDEAFALADRVAVLSGGRLLQIGSRQNIFERPVSAAVAELAGFENRLAGIVDGHDGDHLAIVVGGVKFFARGAFNAGAMVVACVRAEAVSLAGTADETSINRVAGKIVLVAPGLTRRRVVVDCGSFCLVAKVDRGGRSKLDPRVGDEVEALFAPAAVHVIADR